MARLLPVFLALVLFVALMTECNGWIFRRNRRRRRPTRPVFRPYCCFYRGCNKLGDRCCHKGKTCQRRGRRYYCRRSCRRGRDAEGEEPALDIPESLDP